MKHHEKVKYTFYDIVCLIKYNLGQKYYPPQVQPDRGLNSWPPDHDSAFHVTEMLTLTTWPQTGVVEREPIILPRCQDQAAILVLPSRSLQDYCSCYKLNKGLVSINSTSPIYLSFLQFIHQLASDYHYYTKFQLMG